MEKTVIQLNGNDIGRYLVLEDPNEPGEQAERLIGKLTGVKHASSAWVDLEIRTLRNNVVVTLPNDFPVSYVP